MENRGQRLLLIWTLTGLLFAEFVASQEQNCSLVKCPPMLAIECPPDSYPDEFHEQTAITTDEDHMIVEEILVNCCVMKKCSCKDVCEVPACHNNSLVPSEVELGSKIPGKCCPQYECIFEPNCTEIVNTFGHWLIDCQRCQCLAGQKICHRSCDEIRSPPANCLSLNHTIFSNGDTWKEDECTQCECHNGEKNCLTSMCRAQNCAHKVKLEGECCPICVNIEDEKESEEKDTVPLHTQSKPCTTSDNPASVRTEVIEVVLPTRQNCILYGVIVALTIVLIIFIGLYFHEKSKQRSYRPVSALDDNFNKITGKIQSKEFTFA